MFLFCLTFIINHLHSVEVVCRWCECSFSYFLTDHVLRNYRVTQQPHTSYHAVTEYFDFVHLFHIITGILWRFLIFQVVGYWKSELTLFFSHFWPLTPMHGAFYRLQGIKTYFRTFSLYSTEKSSTITSKAAAFFSETLNRSGRTLQRSSSLFFVMVIYSMSR